MQPQAWTCLYVALLFLGRLVREDHTTELISVFQQDWNKKIILTNKNGGSLWVSSTNKKDKYLNCHCKCYMKFNKVQVVTAFFLITSIWNSQFEKKIKMKSSLQSKCKCSLQFWQKFFSWNFKADVFFSLGMLMTSTTDAGFFCCCLTNN